MNYNEFYNQFLGCQDFHEKNRFIVQSLIRANTDFVDDKDIEPYVNLPFFIGKVKATTISGVAFIIDIQHIFGDDLVSYPYDYGSTLRGYIHLDKESYAAGEKLVFIPCYGRLSRVNELLDATNELSFSKLRLPADATPLQILEKLKKKQPYNEYNIDAGIEWVKAKMQNDLATFEVGIQERRNSIEKEYNDFIDDIERKKEKAKDTYDKFISGIEVKKVAKNSEYTSFSEEIETMKRSIQEDYERIKSQNDENIRKMQDEIKASLAERAITESLLKEAQQIRQQYSMLGLIPVDASTQRNEQTSVEKITPDTYEDLVNSTISYVINNCGLDKYSNKERIIERFLNTIFTNQLIILSGKPGSGKTSLPVAVAEAIGAECRIISVQPNWTDNQDLLGFYSPIDHTYHSTPFLDSLREAAFFPDKIFFICLDEMNLAHVEYYFSEILSGMEKKNKEIRLHNNHIHTSTETLARLKEKCGCNINTEGITSELLTSVKRHLEDSDDEVVKLWDEYQYPATIQIPSNVVFIGTLNMDGTTYDLSPKVLDRSYVLQIERDTDSNHYYSADPSLACKMDTSAGLYRSLRAGQSIESNITNEIINRLQGVEKALTKLHECTAEFMPECLSSRFWARLDEMIKQNAAWLNDDKAIKLFVSDVLAGKLLPVMNCQKALSQDEYEKIRKTISEACGSESFVVNSKWYASIKQGARLEYGWRR